MKKYLQTFIKDIVPVVAGILIALFINNWNRDRQEEKYFKEIIEAIHTELDETQKDIEEKIPMQYSLIDSVDFYLENEELSLIEVVAGAGGVSLPTIRMNAWKAIANSKIELLSYEELSALADLQDTKELLSEKAKFLLNFTYSNMSATDSDKKVVFRLLIYDIISTESAILDDIEQIKTVE